VIPLATAMFARNEDTARIGVLRAATRAARLIDGLAGAGVERRLAADLALAIGPGGHTGEAIRRAALVAIGQAGRD
ncbi:MAG TPA: hypothetical protein VIH00_09360, partial [Candidatus Limnocylindrales bacterium]